MIRVQVYVDERLLRAVDEVARRQRWSRSKALAWLAEKRLLDKYPELLSEEAPSVR